MACGSVGDAGRLGEFFTDDHQCLLAFQKFGFIGGKQRVDLGIIEYSVHFRQVTFVFQPHFSNRIIFNIRSPQMDLPAAGIEQRGLRIISSVAFQKMSDVTQGERNVTLLIMPAEIGRRHARSPFKHKYQLNHDFTVSFLGTFANCSTNTGQMRINSQ